MECIGSWVAIVTPFDQNGGVDYGALKSIIDFQADNGTDMLFIMGSAGEVPMLTPEERREIVKQTASYAKGRIKTFYGATLPTTEATVDFSRYAESEGADGLVYSAPAYCMPNQEALREFTLTAMKSVGVPVGVYINPARTGVMLSPDSLEYLAGECGNFAVIKEGLGSIQHLHDVVLRLGDKLSVMGVDAPSCGNWFASLAMGATGISNAVGNVIPQETATMSKPWKTFDDMENCRKTIFQYDPLIRALNTVASPVCIKAAMRMLGLPGGYLRKPLLELDGEPLHKLRHAMEVLGVFEKYGRN